MKKTYEKLLKQIKNCNSIEELEEIYMNCQKFKEDYDNNKEYKKLWEIFFVSRNIN